MRNEIAELNRGRADQLRGERFDRRCAKPNAERWQAHRRDRLAKATRASARALNVLKTGVDTGTTESSDYEALAQYRIMVDGFISSLAQFSAFDRIMADGNFRITPCVHRSRRHRPRREPEVYPNLLRCQ